MEWPLKRPPIPTDQISNWSLYYLSACSTPADPTIVWGTDVPVAGLEAYVRAVNRESDVLISPAHVLICAVGRCLARHPQFNRRVVRRRLYAFKQVNVLMPVLDAAKNPEVCLLAEVDRKSLAEIARDTWQHARSLAQGTSTYLRLGRAFRWVPGWLRGPLFRYMLFEANWFNCPAVPWTQRNVRAGTLINYLGHRGAPPMLMYKPARFPNDACTLMVVMGPTQTDDPRGARAPFFVRADHRVVDAYQMGEFIADLRAFLMDPASMESVVA